MIKSKKLLKFNEINHAFFNRVGGRSKGIYKSLNCGMGSSDRKIDVLHNLKKACKKFNCSFNNLILLNQIHSNKFHIIKKNYKSKKKLKGDALITESKKVALGILTADCIPLLIFDKEKKIISAIHVGWRGAYKNIVNRVVNFLLKKGSNIKNLTAVIGPSISQNNYEVQKEFMAKFIKKDKKNKFFFKYVNKKTYFSLNKYVYSQLKRIGIQKLEIIQKDTFNPKNNFFSARRSIHNKENDYGRNISLIMIK